MVTLPVGTVTFLFTDIEASTRLLQQLADRYVQVLDGYRQLLRAAIHEHGGQEVDNQGDALFAAFGSAREALLAAVSAQRRILSHPWPEGASVRVRMGLHTGEARVAETRYVGIDVHRAARIGAAGHGGQLLVSGATAVLVRRDLPEGVSLRDLGEHRLRDFPHAEQLFQVVGEGLPTAFPPLRTPDLLPNNLPIQLTSFVGREHEKAEVKRLLAATRLLILTGSGGAGKTRLALEVAGELLDQYADGVWLVELAALGDPALVSQAVAGALGIRDESGRPLLAMLGDYLRPKQALLILDNCEHVLASCAELADALLRTCPKLRIMATSREAFGITGELGYRIPSLSLPDSGNWSPDQLAHSEAVRLFVERAALSQPDFTITPANATAVAQVCRRLDGLPLAIELAAARVKALSAEQIASRLDDRFRLLAGGPYRAPETPDPARGYGLELQPPR